jgi:hypothetical protein
MTYFKVELKHLPAGTEENTEIAISIRTALRITDVYIDVVKVKFSPLQALEALRVVRG